jgi:hypothetical protein
MVDLLLTRPEVDPRRVVLTGRSFGGLTAPRGASGEPRLAAMIADPGQYDIAAGVEQRLGDMFKTVDDPSSDPQWNALLDDPGLKAFFAPRMATHGITSPRLYIGELRKFNNIETAPKITCPSFITDNETDVVSTGQGQVLFDHLTCTKTFRRFTKAEGAEGHCEGMAPIVFWTAAFDWLDDTLV